MKGSKVHKAKAGDNLWSMFSECGKDVSFFWRSFKWNRVTCMLCLKKRKR